MSSGFKISELPELFELHLFLALYETRTVKAAAERLHRSPSAVSMRLKGLEAKLGRTLFERTGRQLQPTADGELLASYSHEILAKVCDTKEAFQRCGSTRVEIGAMDSTAAARLGPVLYALRSQYSDISFSLRTGTSCEMARRVSESTLDVAFVADAHRPYTQPLDHRPVFREELVIVSPPGRRGIRSADDVREEVVLAFGEGCVYRERLFEWYRASNIEPPVVMDVWSYSAILSSVASGTGIAMVPLSTLGLYRCAQSIAVHRLDPRDALSVTSMVWPRRRPHSRAISALLDHALSAACMTSEHQCQQV